MKGEVANMAKKIVSFIPAKPIEVIKGLPETSKKRVCAYCRVSTDSEEQQTSYVAQVDYYTNYIKNKPDWEYVDIYADEGISGTNTNKRTDFQRMINDCEEGKIDLIITKSISRFARNTLDCLKYVRQLKEKGIGIFFEKENINTLDSKGEVLLTILSSLAQDESRNISENIKWSYARQFQNGRVIVNHKRFLGYDKDENGELIINEEEAKVVRRIFNEYLSGLSFQKIAQGLERDKVKTGAGKTKWWDSSVERILGNEKYYGNVILQKTYTVDFLTHKRVKNDGIVPQYLIENNHEPIISKEVFDLVQAERERRARLFKNTPEIRNKYSNKYAMSSKVICGNCGGRFRRRVWNSKDKYRRYVWQCSTYIEEGKSVCDMKGVGEVQLKEIFVRMFNRLYTEKDSFIRTMVNNISKVIGADRNDKEAKELDEKIAKLKDEIKKLVRFNVQNNLDSTIYTEEYTRLSHELDICRQKQIDMDKDTARKEDMKNRIEDIANLLKSRKELLEEFDDELFIALVDHIKVTSPVHLIFVLKSGIEVEELL